MIIISVAMRPTEDINPQPARGIPTLIKPRRARLMVQRTTSQTCFHCGRAGHLARHCQTCQIYRRPGHTANNCGTCFRCGRTGHSARDCRAFDRQQHRLPNWSRDRGSGRSPSVDRRDRQSGIN